MPKVQFLSASTFPDLMSNNRSKDGLGQKALEHVFKHASELLGGKELEEQFIPSACQWGIDNEPHAAKIYEQRTLATPILAAWKTAPDCPFAGGTIDRLIGKNGGLEIKCPATFGRHLKHDELFKLYFYQFHGYLWIYELDWIDFCNYDPRFPEPYDLFTTRIYRDDNIIKALKARCELVHSMALDMIEQLKKDDSPIIQL